jgi:hypothetical protein
MAISSLTAYTAIPADSLATTGLWDYRFGVLHRNVDQLNNDASGGTAVGVAGFSTNTIRVESGVTTTFVSGASLIVSNLNSIRFLTPSGGDDTSAIQAVLDALPTGGFGSLRGGLVQLSVGTFITSSSLSVPPGCVLRGVSREGSVISFSGGGFAITIGVGTATNSKGVAVVDLYIRGGASASGAIQVGDTNVGSNFVSDLKLSHLQISDFTAASGVTAIFLQNPSHVYADLVHVYNCPSGTALHVDANGLNTGVYVFNACRFGGSSSIEVKKACVLTSTSNVIDGIVFNGCFFRGTKIVIDIDNARAANFFGCHIESSSTDTTMIRAKTWLGSTFLGNTLYGSAVAPIGIHILGTGSARRLLIGHNWFNDMLSTGTAIQITPPGAGTVDDIVLLPNHFDTTTPTEVGDSGLLATVISDNTVQMARYLARGSGSALAPSFRFGSEQSLGWYRSANSRLGLSYGQIVVPAGSTAEPPYAFTSEKTLGWYRSGASTMALSYGTLNLATSSVRLSMRTITASALTASAANTNVAVNEAVFTVGGASGASLAIHSGGTVYIFDSVSSAKAT